MAVSYPCERTTLLGEPCKRRVAVPGAPCGAPHREDLVSWSQGGEAVTAVSAGLPSNMDDLLGFNPPVDWATSAGLRAFNEAYLAGRRARDDLLAGKRSSLVGFEARDSALGGLGDRDGGRAFGWEIEFELPTPETAGDSDITANFELLDEIGSALYRDGFLATREVADYHGGVCEDEFRHERGWRFELDHTVRGGAELISPICYDTKETWDRLERAIDILRRHGGRPGPSAGCHINVSLFDFGASLRPHNQLIAMAVGNTDSLFRILGDPERGEHRLASGNVLATPNSLPPGGVGAFVDLRVERDAAVSLAHHDNGKARGRVEYRAPDSTLRADVIQAQTHLLLAFTTEAKKRAASDGLDSYRRISPEPLGAHSGCGEGPGSSGWAEATQSVRSLIESLFPGDEPAKRRATCLFAAGKWLDRHLLGDLGLAA